MIEVGPIQLHRLRLSFPHYGAREFSRTPDELTERRPVADACLTNGRTVSSNQLFMDLCRRQISEDVCVYTFRIMLICF